jgi:succinate dehydrogenase / fumarate reductase, cytochrome b subunit
MTSAPRPRPKYYDLNLLHLPPAGLVSIFHRVSGGLLFLGIPVLLYTLQLALSSEAGFAQVKQCLSMPLAKIALLGITWLYAHHFFAGIRYLLLDFHIGIEKRPSGISARVVLALGVIATLVVAGILW